VCFSPGKAQEAWAAGIVSFGDFNKSARFFYQLPVPLKARVSNGPVCTPGFYKSAYYDFTASGMVGCGGGFSVLHTEIF
jgi:hypothetical protein